MGSGLAGLRMNGGLTEESFVMSRNYLFLVARLHRKGEAQVAHTCNLSYSGGRDLGSKPSRVNSSTRPYLKQPITKRGWWSGSRCRP
jgi:hypothetical protein